MCLETRIVANLASPAGPCLQGTDTRNAAAPPLSGPTNLIRSNHCHLPSHPAPRISYELFSIQEIDNNGTCSLEFIWHEAAHNGITH